MLTSFLDNFLAIYMQIPSECFIIQQVSKLIISLIELFEFLLKTLMSFLLLVSGKPISYAFVTPSVTPKDYNNPGFRLYKFDDNTGKVSSY